MTINYAILYRLKYFVKILSWKEWEGFYKKIFLIFSGSLLFYFIQVGSNGPKIFVYNNQKHTEHTY